MALETISETSAFGGRQGTYGHRSAVLDCAMRFSVFTPPQAAAGKVPLVWYLSGLTCTEENATVKAGFQRVAADLGLMIVCPDTSPRGDAVADDAAYDLGQGAGFYLNATQAPWSAHFHMERYITRELPTLIAAHFPGDMTRQAVTGHSMGGHGALALGIKNPQLYRSISAFAPIVAPTHCPWGEKAFSAYLGDDKQAWEAHDACRLIVAKGSPGSPILIDQGLDDPFLESQLMPQLFEDACARAGQSLTLRRHAGYDHGYFFIATFMEDHLRHHARLLGCEMADPRPGTK